MPSSKFVISSNVGDSFRISKVKGMFDCQLSTVEKIFDVSIPIEDMSWNVGMIVGASGSGKTTIAKNLFKNYKIFQGFEWSQASILDDFEESLSAKEITEVLSKVGFSSPPDWLKPFSVLSNGQKMRAELARLILESSEPFIYDEFTSVVDRQTAKIGSCAIQKFVRKQNKQFIAVSCHYDICEWLEPDWVFDANKNEFSRRSLRRPLIEVKIRKALQKEWLLFKEFHYLSSEHNNAAHKYIAEIDKEPVAWCSVLHFPHPKVKNMKRIHRIVVRPDYQGIGIGNYFMSEIGNIYKNQGFRCTLITSAPSFVHGLQANKSWVMTSKPGRMHKNGNKKDYNNISKKNSSGRLTATFEFVGAKNANS